MADEDEEFDEEGVVVGQLPVVSVPRHIKKRSLKNKALNVGFNDKELRDFVTGFHKRKKKRRKEAQKQLQEKERLQRIQARKKRKREREMAIYGRVLSSENPPEAASELNDADDYEQDNEDIAVSVSETKMYEDDNTTITVTTCAISHEDDDELNQTNDVSMVSSRNEKPERPRALALKKKPLKKVAKHRSKKGGKKRASGKKAKKNGRNKVVR